MSETRRDPPPPLNSPPSPAETTPTVGLDQEALAIIERAAMEMAGRKPPKHLTEHVTEHVTEPTPEPADILAGQAGPSAPATPSQEPEPPMETQPAEAPLTQDTPTGEIKPAEEMQPAAELNPADEIKPTEDAKPIEDIKPVAEIKLVAQFDPMPLIAATAPIAPAQATLAPPAFRPMFDDHFSLSLTGLQSAALATAIFVFLIGAIGMAAYGWVAAHDWSCRLGMVTNYCPPASGTKPLLRPEIPT